MWGYLILSEYFFCYRDVNSKNYLFLEIVSLIFSDSFSKCFKDIRKIKKKSISTTIRGDLK